MARRTAEESWDEDDEHDDELDSEHELDDEELEALLNDDNETISCPYCQKEIYEDAQRCPYCERYLSAEDQPNLPKPLWIIVGFALAGAVSLMWLLG